MRVHVVSDVHGNVDALARAGDGADALVVLGDLIDFVDYHDPQGGILGRLFGPEVTSRFARLRSAGEPGEMGEFVRSLWSRLDDPTAVIDAAIREQYAELFAAMSAPTYATPGNVDRPDLWPEFASDRVRVLDGEVAEIGGLRFGFLGGAPLPPGVQPRSSAPWRAYMRTAEEFAAAAGRLRDVDVLCSHVPPAVPELAYDVDARRPEMSSGELLGIIRRDRPRTALFGHVHQPLCTRTRIGCTECVNVGHFRITGAPYVLRW
jgi:Icc-related predicted phosphoesterase